MSLIHNERTKLLANALDRAATACFTVGIATPLAGYIYNVSNFRSSVGNDVLMIGLVGWLVASVTLHLAGRLVLKGLRQ